MLKRRDHIAISLGWILIGLAVALLCVVLMSGCHSRQPLTTTVTDSTATQVRTVYRDTTIYVHGDSVSTTLGTDWTAMHALMAELTKGPRVVRGERQASVVITKVDSTHFNVEARCDSVQLKLDSALVHVEVLTTRLVHVQEQVAVANDRMLIPGLWKGIALVIGMLCILVLLIALLPTLKHILPHGTA